MSSLFLTPESLDITLYGGDTYNISLSVLDDDGSQYSTTGSWRINFFNKETSTLLDTSPTGVSFAPKINENAPLGVTSLTISKTLSQLLASTASVTYEFYLQHDGRQDRYTFLNGDVTILTKEDI
jgi:hypothetical protein